MGKIVLYGLVALMLAWVALITLIWLADVLEPLLTWGRRHRPKRR